MSIGFRNSLFGFNRNDVINYIQKTHQTFSKNTESINEQAKLLEKELKLSNEQVEKLTSEKNFIQAKLDEFLAKYQEIERLSESIAKLYLIAQANAQAIIENSQKNAELLGEEVKKNLSTLDEAHTSLSALRDNISKTSNDFISEVDALISSLTETREKITENQNTIDSAKESFDNEFSNIVE